MILLQRQRQPRIASMLVGQESDAVSAAQRCAVDARKRLHAALADDDEVQRVTNELRELRSHKDFEDILLCTLRNDLQ